MNNQPVIPSFTGNPILDTAIRGLLLSVGGAIVAWLTTLLTAHGLGSATIIAEVPTLVFAALAFLATLAVYLWTLLVKKATASNVVEHVLDAAVTGQVAATVKAMATPVQAANITKAGK